MGQAQSRVGDDDQQPAMRIDDGVRVTQQLLEQLSGRHRPHNAQRDATALTSPPVSSLPQKEEETVVIIQQDPQLEEALQQSRRVGDLLLKNEEQETAEINRLAADLLDREYRAPLKEPPCMKERRACIQCYKEHVQDALKCQDAVRAYSQCAQRVFAG